MPINVLTPHGSLTRALRFTAVVGVMLLVPSALAGCGGKESAAPAASVTATAAQSPAQVSSSPGIPPKPADTYPWEAPQAPSTMYEHTEEGAIATAEYFVELMGYMASTADTKEFERISADDCEYCNNQLQYVDQYWADNGWISGLRTTEHTLLGSFISDGTIPSERGVIFRIETPAYEYYLPNDPDVDTPHGTLPEDKFELAVGLDWNGDRWIISGGSGRESQQ